MTERRPAIIAWTAWRATSEAWTTIIPGSSDSGEKPARSPKPVSTGPG